MVDMQSLSSGDLLETSGARSEAGSGHGSRNQELVEAAAVEAGERGEGASSAGSALPGDLAISSDEEDEAADRAVAGLAAAAAVSRCSLSSSSSSGDRARHERNLMFLRLRKVRCLMPLKANGWDLNDSNLT